MLHLDTLGRLALSDGTAPLLPRRRKELVLLAFLAWRAPRPVPRAELAALLWGARDETRARQSLRQALSTLRSVLGDRLHANADDVRLDPGWVSLDVRRFEEALAAGDHGAAVALWHGDFLAGAEELGEEELRSWLERERASLRLRLGAAYARLVEECRAAGQSRAAIEHAAAWSEALPFDERAHHELVSALRLAGRTVDARAGHRAFVTRLRDEMGAAPSPEFLLLGRALDADTSASRVGARALLTPDFVGRAGVLGRLDDAWRRVRRGESAAVLLQGDEGVGRTRLCRELLRAVRESGKPAVVLEGRAYESERERPWSTLRTILPGLLEARGLLAAPASAIAALATVSPEVAERFPRLPASDQLMTPEEGISRVLAEVSVETPVLLVVDDATSADGASAAVLGALIRRPPGRTLLLLTARAGSLAGSPLAADVAQAGSLVTEISLQPLDVSEVETMAASMMPLAEEIARPLAERLHRDTAGNPGQVERLLSTWADGGVLSTRADGRWISTRALDGELPIPSGLRESLAERLRHLTPDARRVAEAATVWSGEIATATLEAIAGVDGDRFATALGELLSRRLLRESSRQPGTHELANDAMRRALYASLPPSRRRALHRAAARALRAQPPGPEHDRRLREQVALGGRPLFRGRWVAVGAIAAAVVLLAAGRIVASRAAAVPRGAGVVLADIENATSDSTLGRTFHSAAVIGLQDSRHVSLLPRARIRETLERMRRPDAPFTEPLAREVAVREGLASVIVLGVSQVDSSFLLTARIVDPVQGGDLGARSVRVTGRGALLGGLDQLLAGVRRDLGESGESLGRRRPHLPRITTSSLEALRAFVDGRDAYSRQDFVRAGELFERAIAVDPEFALAHAFLSDVAWFGRIDRAAAKVHLDHALALTDRLTERERLRIRGQAADRFGNPLEATTLFQMLAQRHPDRDTWYTLGMHLVQQRRCDEAEEAFRRSLGFDRRHHMAHVGIARCRTLAGDGEGALAAYAAAARVDSLALVRGNVNHEWGSAFVLANRLADAEKAFRLQLVRPAPMDRVRGHRSLAWLEVYRGRYRAAATHLREGIAISRRATLTLPEMRDRTMLAELLAARGLRGAAAAQLDSVAALSGQQSVPESFHVYIGFAALRLGRLAQARAAAAAIDRQRTGGLSRELSRRALASALLLADGQATAAKVMADPDLGEEHRSRRLAVQAQAFAASGQLDSAIVAATRLSETFAFGWEEQLEWMRGPLLVARYAETRGDTATARDAYRRVVERWKEGDPDLMDLVAARRGLARLAPPR